MSIPDLYRKQLTLVIYLKTTLIIILCDTGSFQLLIPMDHPNGLLLYLRERWRAGIVR